MDWVRDCAGVKNDDLNDVFGYEWQRTTVVQLRQNGILRTWELESEKQWEAWLQENVPTLNGETTPVAEPGLTLILAGRTQRPLRLHDEKELDEGLESTLSDPSGSTKTEAADDGLDFSPSILRCVYSGPSQGMLNDGTEPSLRILPFGLDTFRSITRRFCTHGSIARVINRSDVPTFTAAKVQMDDLEGRDRPAYVYNARSSKVWKMDLALTATHFPHSHHTYAILFGGSEDLEKVICRRLELCGADVAHPLLMVGILAEAERAKHVLIIEETMDKLESKIFYLSKQTAVRDELTTEQIQERSRERNDVWLDTAYLRNKLITWTTQLEEMIRHAEELDFGSLLPSTSEVSQDDDSRHDSFILPAIRERDASTMESQASTHKRIINRLKVIVNEYHDKIRDCSMLLDGMTMATQWDKSHSDTNVEIAMATNRDSRYMRSIALITMIFLPGTFLASVFSMTFFDWFNEKGEKTVSESIWIYFVIAGCFTAITLGLWYYWTSRKPRRM